VDFGGLVSFHLLLVEDLTSAYRVKIMPDRYAPWILAVTIGFVAWKPLSGTQEAIGVAGLLTFLGGGVLGFIGGLPFWWRHRRMRK
jgi:hypothetical protein